jgi:flagellin
MASNAARHLSSAYGSLAKSVERLASGLRINGAKDDAAGLAVRELIRADIAVQRQGTRNAMDGISMLQTMEGAMGVMDENLVRMKELAEQAATGSYSSAQRSIMNAEFAEMADEIERIAESTRFNGIAMLNSSTGSVSIHVGTSMTVDIDKVDMTKGGLGINTGIEVNEVTFNAAMAATDAGAFITVGTEDAVLEITFDNSGDAEDTISIDLVAGSYTMDQIASAINAESQTLGYAPDGTDKSYKMATIVTNDDGTFSLKLASRNAADGVTMEVTAAGAGTFQLSGGVSTVTSTTAAAVNAADYEAAQVIGGVNIATVEAASAALDILSVAINVKDEARAAFGYKMNHLEKTIAILDIQAENLMAAESRISDVDVATEMATLTRTQVLSQAGTNMLAQASRMPEMALTLLR